MWKDRDDFLRTCIAMGLNARQIHVLSLSSPAPLNSTQRVYQKISEQGLERLYRSRRIERRRRGYHNEHIIRAFMKLCGQGMEYGYEVTEVLRDAVPHPGVRFRPDLGLKVGDRQFFAEVQLSRIEFTRWHAKLAQYVRLYETARRPFRVLLLLADDGAVARVREYARHVLKDRPSLNLFLLMPLARFDREPDVMKGKVWLGVRDPKERHSLM